MARDLPPRLAEQRALQLRISARRRTRWISWIFAAGLLVSLAGLAAALLAWRDGVGSLGGVLGFGSATLLFGITAWQWLTWPLFAKPRLVPCFATRLGEPRGLASAAFWRRGGDLYRHAAALDAAAERLGVRPLSDFGYADAFYEQQVSWHRADEGLATVEALRAAPAADLASRRELALDLQALESALRIAADRGIAFSLVLRLGSGESLQMIQTREERQGSFW